MDSKLRAFGNYDRDAVSLATGVSFEGSVSKTQQQFAEEVDINTIVRRFGLTGEMPSDLRLPQSGDFTGIVDFASAMKAVREAEEAFMELPAAVRSRFQHDPQNLLQFLEDPSNKDEAVKLGLVEKPPEITRPAAPDVVG